MKLALILAIGAAALATPALASAGDHGSKGGKHGDRSEGYGDMRHGEEMRYRHANLDRGCAKWKHGRCHYKHGHGYAYGQQRRAADYRVGYRFAPNYGYTPYGQIPSNYANQYHLSPDGRYVYRNNYIYQVNPRTNAVERVLYALTH